MSDCKLSGIRGTMGVGICHGGIGLCFGVEGRQVGVIRDHTLGVDVEPGPVGGGWVYVHKIIGKDNLKGSGNNV